MKQQDIKEFKKDLKNLLEKYKVQIGFSCDDCSDTYGLSGEKLVVVHKSDFQEHTLTTGWFLDQSDL